MEMLINDAKEKSQNKSIYSEQELSMATVRALDLALIIVDLNGKIIFCNQKANSITGYTREEMINAKLTSFYKSLNEHSREYIDYSTESLFRYGQEARRNQCKVLMKNNGEEIMIEESIQFLSDKNNQHFGFLIAFQDVTEQKKMQKQIEQLHYYDYLTGVYNRKYIEEAMLLLDTEKNLPFTVMVMDLNALKLTNDAFGHETGDKLLVEISKNLKKICRSNDIIGRIGGDEFCMLLPNTDSYSAEKIKKRINRAMSMISVDSVIVSLAVGSATKRYKDEELKRVRLQAYKRMYQDKLKNGKTMRNKIVEVLMEKNMQKFTYEKDHTESVAFYCEEIGKALGFDPDTCCNLRLAGAVHDIGKVIIPEKTLEKHTKLTEYEKDLVKKHSETGYFILKAVDQYLKIAEAVLYHHERWDGSGYPEGLKEEQIPLFSRIIAVADAYDAMTSYRPYKEKMTHCEALQELSRCSGSQFDPRIVTLFIDHFQFHYEEN